MKILDKVLTIGDLRKKIEKMDDNIELEVSMPSSNSVLAAYPCSSMGESYRVKDVESMERIGPSRFTFFPITEANITANPDSYSQELKDRIVAINAPHVCKVKEKV